MYDNISKFSGNIWARTFRRAGNHIYVLLQALEGRGAPDANILGSDIPIKSLPHCKKTCCGGLLRPHIVWFGENLERAVLEKTGQYINQLFY